MRTLEKVKIKVADYYSSILITLGLILIFTAFRKIQLFVFSNPYELPFVGYLTLSGTQIRWLLLGFAIFELVVATGLIFARTRRVALLGYSIFVFGGVLLSVLDFILSSQSTCECGLLTDNPYLILIQKIIILMLVLTALKLSKGE